MWWEKIKYSNRQRERGTCRRPSSWMGQLPARKRDRPKMSRVQPHRCRHRWMICVNYRLWIVGIKNGAACTRSARVGGRCLFCCVCDAGPRSQMIPCMLLLMTVARAKPPQCGYCSHTWSTRRRSGHGLRPLITNTAPWPFYTISVVSIQVNFIYRSLF